MTDLFEQRLRRALAREADRTPLVHREWRPREEAADRPSAPRVARYAAAAAAVGLVVGTGVTLLAVSNRDQSALRSTAVPPDGTEVPMVPRSTSGVVLAPGNSPVKPGSAYAFRVDDRLVGTSELMWWMGVDEPVETQQCLFADAAGGKCTPPDAEISATEWRFTPGGDWILVRGLPNRTAYVEVTIAGDTYWQDPLRDLALFPDPDPRADMPWSARVVLNDGEVIEVSPASEEDAPPSSSPPKPTESTRYPDDISIEVLDVVESTGRECLEDAGLPNPLAPVPDGIDVDAVWAACVEDANAAVNKYFRDIADAARELSIEARGELVTSTEPAG